MYKSIISFLFFESNPPPSRGPCSTNARPLTDATIMEFPLINLPKTPMLLQMIPCPSRSGSIFLSISSRCTSFTVTPNSISCGNSIIVAWSACVVAQSFSLYHNTLIAYVDKHLKFCNHLILLSDAFLKLLDLLLTLVFDFCQFLPGPGQLFSQI